ncbi:3-dehydroquinate synthase [Burkholderia ubonensis]|uniref:3-dehydroquinate synthase n=1 Tax=Burkholderia ubonensis subsp. mesacidophila TaxID=265293 RepID=A0A2A4FAD8_9BURK|nr:3-dehydroquinate synthase [Burkholderia ubonensis]PCE29544.1 3-dehydroquinate synthase [Burkholderia ubonensis subsp. mesacidophila]
MLEHRIDQTFEVRYSYPVCFTRRAFSPANALLADLMRNPAQGLCARALFVIDSGVTDSRADRIASIARYAREHTAAFELAGSPIVVRGGEASKHGLQEVDVIYDLVRELRLCRHSYVVAVGGGALLDAVGYAAATAHRGIRLIRMPSTVLGQNDAGIGVKNAVNWHGRKNFVGTFAPPFAVVNDFDLLASAPAVVRRAGIAEAIKVALIRDARYFARLHEQRFELAMLAPHAIEPMIVRCAELHLAQIRDGGDPFERGSARPLDFGHWSAHKLEEISHHRLLHGEAVAIGMAIDTLYSRRLGLIDGAAADLVLDTLRDIGFTLDDAALDTFDVDRALDEFREHLGGSLCITLLKRIGEGVEVNYIDAAVMRACVAELRACRQPVHATSLAPEVST